MIKKIRSKIDTFYRHNFVDKQKERILIKKIEATLKPRLIIIDIPEHGNIGDHAIAIAQNYFLKNNFENYELIEIPAGVSHLMISYLQDLMSDEDIILFHGGGNFGTLYRSHDKLRANTINNLTHSKFIQLPQTIYFSNNEDGKEKIVNSQKIYESKRDNIVFCAREQESYSRLREYFPNNNSILVPDIVFSMDKLNYSGSRNGIITLLRDDFESANIENNSKLINSLKNNFSTVNISDTHLGYGSYIEIEEREKIVFDKLKEVSKHEVVVTDRLHGMIFAYLTETPCIALDNNNHKVRDTYNTWLKNCNYIYFSNNLAEEKIVDIVYELRNLKPIKHDLTPFFSSLKETIKAAEGSL